MKFINETTIRYIYGLVVFVAVFLFGWISGMGGSIVANLVFALVMGTLAAVAISIIIKFGKPKE